MKTCKMNFLLIASLVAFVSGCNKGPAKLPGLSSLAQEGRAVYLANCIACHNPDPRLAGSIAPEISGARIELLTEKMLRKTYPPGHTPKRKSNQMPDFPKLEKDIPALEAYLRTFN